MSWSNRRFPISYKMLRLPTLLLFNSSKSGKTHVVKVEILLHVKLRLWLGAYITRQVYFVCFKAKHNFPNEALGINFSNELIIFIIYIYIYICTCIYVYTYIYIFGYTYNLETYMKTHRCPYPHLQINISNTTTKGSSKSSWKMCIWKKYKWNSKFLC